MVEMTDYEKIISLVSWERQARVRHLFDELKKVTLMMQQLQQAEQVDQQKNI